MGSLKNSETGFSAVETVLVLVIVGIVGFVGWYVVSHKNKTNKPTTATSSRNSAQPNGSQSKTNSTQQADSYAGWQQYSDDFVSFKYPSSWKATRNDNKNLSGTKGLDLVGPVDTAIADSTGKVSSKDAYIAFNIFKPIDPHCNCKVYDVLPLSMPGIKAAKMAITSATGVNEDPTTPAAALVVTDGSVSIGATTLKAGVTVGSDNAGLTGVIGGGLRITDIKTFESSQSVQDLIKILNTMTIK